MCKHFWQPIEGWVGRYRCTHCKAVGYRGAVTAEHHEGNITGIYPYVCQKTGCSEVAVQKRSTDPATGRAKKIQRCAEHRV